MFGRLNASIVVGGSLCLLGVLAGYFSLQIPAEANGDTGARTFPFLAAGALLVLGALEARKGLYAPAQKQLALPARAPAVLGTIAIGIFYVWMISKLGYLIATAVAAPLILMVFGLRNPLGLLAAAVLCPVVYHLIFFELLGVFPPYGEWFDLLDLLHGG